jgi:uncharacterized protein YndB with AHSA1/START domain
MTATTQITPDNDAIITQIFISAPPARVFTALIDRAQALQWGKGPMFEMAAWELDPRPGGKWSFVSEEIGSKKKFAHHGKVLKIDPPHLLEYTWIADWHSDLTHDTVVRWDLTAVSGGTELKVTHSRLAAFPNERKGYAGGWPGLVTQIKQFVENNS